jgi:hypothetical protein
VNFHVAFSRYLCVAFSPSPHSSCTTCNFAFRTHSLIACLAGHLPNFRLTPPFSRSLSLVPRTLSSGTSSTTRTHNHNRSCPCLTSASSGSTPHIPYRYLVARKEGIPACSTTLSSSHLGKSCRTLFGMRGRWCNLVQGSRGFAMVKRGLRGRYIGRLGSDHQLGFSWSPGKNQASRLAREFRRQTRSNSRCW